MQLILTLIYVGVHSRDLRPSNRLAMRSYLELVDVPGLINSGISCEAKVTLFQQIITTGLDAISPFQSKTVCS